MSTKQSNQITDSLDLVVLSENRLSVNPSEFGPCFVSLPSRGEKAVAVGGYWPKPLTVTA
jgi:hypothetical protein